jgi:hypothetical protein
MGMNLNLTVLMRGIFACLLCLICATRSTAEKINLRILYVGYDASRPMPDKVAYFSTWEPAMTMAYKTRMDDFKRFLNSRFTTVKLVDVRNYNTSLSQDADVTIFDASPVNLPADFDRPAILLHAMAPNIGIPLHLKFDWYCQCLENDALNVNTAHEIFKTPFKVTPTMVDKPTPLSFFNGHQAATTPKTMKMWTVINDSASAKGKYLIGMVSHGEGFNDSPDAEVISGGDCLKNAEAVAIGRHGNFLMWGFSASPDYMTAEAKDVFVNAICYIRKYDHRPVIVRKVQTATRAEIDELIYRIDENLYKKALIARKQGNVQLLKMQQELRDKKAAGENIGRSNEMFLLMPVTNDLQPFDEYLKQFAGEELYRKFGKDVSRYHQYYRDNYEYFYPEGEMGLKLDTELRSLGTSNRNKMMLDKCISMLENHSMEPLATRLLQRYTNESFATAKNWRNWFNINNGKLFFSETGGFKFFVDSAAVNNQAYVSNAATKTISGQPVPSDPVMISYRLVNSGDPKTVKLVMTAKILAGWHIYAYVPSESPFVQSKINLTVNGKNIRTKWISSPGLALGNSKQTFVYEHTAEFTTMISRGSFTKGKKVIGGLYYQVCNDNKCFPPKEKKVDINL